MGRLDTSAIRALLQTEEQRHVFEQILAVFTTEPSDMLIECNLRHLLIIASKLALTGQQTDGLLDCWTAQLLQDDRRAQAERTLFKLKELFANDDY